MNKALAICISIISFIIILCPVKARSDRLTVVASVFPLYDFAREVAGPAADVHLLLPPGVDPHSWEPKPSDIVELSRADIFLYTSDRLEPWAGTFVKSVRKRDTIIVEVMDRLELMEHHEVEGPEEDHDDEHYESEVHDGELHHGEDAHFWMDLSFSARAVEMIGRSLSEADPDNAGLFRTNAESFAARLRALHEKFIAGLRNCRTRQLVTGGHAAFGHLARRYGLEQVSVYGLSPDAEPSPKHLAGIIKVIRENDIQTVFSEELMNPKMAEVLSQETGARILVLNPAGNLTADQWQRRMTFSDIMQSNLETLREGLYCE